MEIGAFWKGNSFSASIFSLWPFGNSSHVFSRREGHVPAFDHIRLSEVEEKNLHFFGGEGEGGKKRIITWAGLDRFRPISFVRAIPRSFRVLDTPRSRPYLKDKKISSPSGGVGISGPARLDPDLKEERETPKKNWDFSAI